MLTCLVWLALHCGWNALKTVVVVQLVIAAVSVLQLIDWVSCLELE